MTAENMELREMRVEDLAVFFEHQRDPEARRMAAFTSGDPEDRDGFHAKWTRILGDAAVDKRTVLDAGEVAGLIVAFDRDGKREVSYWIGREHWGKGIATAALGAFLQFVTTRPLHALAAKDHRASARVLEKCGFRIVGDQRGFADARGEEIEEYRFELHDAGSTRGEPGR